MVREFLSDFWDFIKERFVLFVTHRLFVFTLFSFTLFGILVVHLFQLQIVEGQEHLDNFNLRTKKTVTIPSSRGEILDVNGNVLAYNKLAYSLKITFEDTKTLTEKAQSEGISLNQYENNMIYELIKILESNGDHLICDFPIIVNSKGKLEFTLSDTSLLRFKKEVYSVGSVDNLTEDQINATAEEVFSYLAYGNGKKSNFGISKDYSLEMALKIMSVRYAIWLNRYSQYEPVTMSKNISEASMVKVYENQADFTGVEVIAESIRVYNDSKYFSHIIGYTGSISDEELTTYNETLPEDSKYTSSAIVGKTGIEKSMEETLRGKDGSSDLCVDNLGKILYVEDTVESVAGNNVYLTIDSDLQKYCYDMLEKHLAEMLLTYIQNTKATFHSETSKKYFIPIDDVYFALIDNNIIQIQDFANEAASENEKTLYESFLSKREKVLNQITTEWNATNTQIKNQTEEYQEYSYYIYNFLVTKGILYVSDKSDEKYVALTQGNISIGDFIKYGISAGWVEISALDISDDYYDTNEIYQEIIDYLNRALIDDVYFDKLIYQFMIKLNEINIKTLCLTLYDQEVLSTEDEDYNLLSIGNISAYEFIRRKIANLEITPAQLALDPCSGSIVITDVNTGALKAMVSYPSYDNNRLVNGADATYLQALLNDQTKPLYNRATSQKTAPGSTFKMISSVAGVQEDVMGINETVYDRVVYTKTGQAAKCWSSSSHGDVNITSAIKNSCNYYFYEVGYRLATKTTGEYNDVFGIALLQKYISMFGLDENTGIELSESEPSVTDKDVVRSAIGQGTNSYTPTQIARYVTTVANSGDLYNLTLIKKIESNTGNVIYENSCEIIRHLDISATLWNAIHLGMRQVVENLSVFSGFEINVAGKTGTAQEDKSRANHALFVSYAPYESPEISVTTVIPYGYSSSNAASVTRDVYAYYYKLAEFAPQDTNLQGENTVRIQD